jgi:hypothetical protein
VGTAEADGADTRIARRGVLVLSCSLVLLIAQAFVPIREFVLRGDDAFYYFGVAASFPRLGAWSFDSIHTTNGVQPLWAGILSVLAQLLSWFGLTDPGTVARIFVALAVILLFASSLVLFRLLRATVSTGTAIVAAGAFLFPMGIVWARAWGMENDLYALLLISTIAYFHLVFLTRPDRVGATVLGVLLGLLVLARLNAITFVVLLLGFFLLWRAGTPLRDRLPAAALAACVAFLVAVPYFAANYAITGHATPISGTVKAISTTDYLRERHIGNRLSPSFVASVYDDYSSSVSWFIRSRAGDAFWAVGGRALTTNAPRTAWLGAALAFFALAPLLLGQPREWIGFLGERFRRLRPFAYVLVFAVVDAIVSIALYPTELFYAMVRWWFVPQEIVIVVLVATLLAASLGYAGRRLLTDRRRVTIVTVGLAALLVFHGQQMFRFYWSEGIRYRDWNQSFNGEMYRAAGWIRAHTPPRAVIGSWNAGVLGYYSRRKVEDLDGLVNGYEIVPYLRRNQIVAFIEHERLGYLADLEGEFTRLHPEVLRQLRLKEVYSHQSPFAHRDYRIYKVLGRA